MIGALREAVQELEVPLDGDGLGWSEKLKPDGTLMITDPKGRVRTTRPPGTLISQ